MSALIFESDIDTDKLHRKVSQIDSELHSLALKAANSGSMLDKSFKQAGVSADQLTKKTINVNNALASIGALVSLSVISQLGKEIVDVTAKFEKFGIVLRNSLGDVKGDEALSMIADFAATTPFQLDEVTGAFIKMTNQGFVPTQKEMVKLGDLASSTGKGFDMLTEAILDAQTGEFERLKEFGIKASQSGDKVTFSFKEQETTVSKTNSAIRGYILSLGELNGIAGANAKISASLTGQISNLHDKIAAMYNEIGSSNSGVIYAAVGGASTLIENYKLIGDVLGELVAVYGAYKVATMAVAYAESVKAASVARNMAIEAEYTAIMAAQNTMMMGQAQIATIQAAARVTATQTVIAAERELAATQRATALANPWVLIPTVVAAAGYAIYKFATYQSDLEKATSKASIEIENERDKAAQLFAILGYAKEGTEDWKKAKDAIITQYGTYLSEQQKELLGTKNQAEAQKAVNDGLKENIALKVKQESLNAASEKYNKDIADATLGINKAVKKALGIDRAAMADQEIAPLISNVKIAIDEESKSKAIKELQDYLQNLGKEAKGDSKILDFDPDVMRFRGDLMVALNKWKTDVDAINKAFDVQMKKTEEKKADSVLTTYQAQIDALKAKKAIAEKELAALKATPGEDPMKAIVAKQGEIDSINNLLGIKEKEKNAVDQLKQAQEALELAVKSGNKTAAIAAADRVSQLEQEKRLIQENIDLELQKAWRRQFDNKPMSSVPSIGVKPITQVGSTKTVQGVLYEITAIDKTGPVWKKVNLERTKLKESEKKLSEKAAEDQEKLDKEVTDKKIKTQQQILEGAMLFTNELIDQLGLSEQQTAQMKQTVGIIGSVSSGNWIGAVFQAASMVVGTLKKETVSFLDITNEQISKTNDLLALHSKILSGLTGDDYYKASAAEIKKINFELDTYNKKLNDVVVTDSRTHRKVDTTNWNSTSWLNALDSSAFDTSIGKEATAAILAQIADLEAKKTALVDEMYQKILGFGASDISDSIFQGIEEGLKLGENSLGGFAQSFGDLMKTALMQAIKNAANSDITNEFLPMLKEFIANDGTIDPTEESILGKWYSDYIKKTQAETDAVKSITDKYGTSSSSSNPLTGISASMTEETGSLVAGQFMAMRVDLKTIQETGMSQLEMMDLGLSVLREIASNTKPLSRLEAIENGIKDLNTNIKNLG